MVDHRQSMVIHESQLRNKLTTLFQRMVGTHCLLAVCEAKKQRDYEYYYINTTVTNGWLGLINLGLFIALYRSVCLFIHGVILCVTYTTSRDPQSLNNFLEYFGNIHDE